MAYRNVHQRATYVPSSSPTPTELETLVAENRARQAAQNVGAEGIEAAWTLVSMRIGVDAAHDTQSVDTISERPRSSSMDTISEQCRSPSPMNGTEPRSSSLDTLTDQSQSLPVSSVADGSSSPTPEWSEDEQLAVWINMVNKVHRERAERQRAQNSIFEERYSMSTGRDVNAGEPFPQRLREREIEAQKAEELGIDYPDSPWGSKKSSGEKKNGRQAARTSDGPAETPCRKRGTGKKSAAKRPAQRDTTAKKPAAKRSAAKAFTETKSPPRRSARHATNTTHQTVAESSSPAEPTEPSPKRQKVVNAFVIADRNRAKAAQAQCEMSTWIPYTKEETDWLLHFFRGHPGISRSEAFGHFRAHFHGLRVASCPDVPRPLRNNKSLYSHCNRHDEIRLAMGVTPR